MVPWDSLSPHTTLGKNSCVQLTQPCPFKWTIFFRKQILKVDDIPLPLPDLTLFSRRMWDDHALMRALAGGSKPRGWASEVLGEAQPWPAGERGWVGWCASGSGNALVCLRVVETCRRAVVMCQRGVEGARRRGWQVQTCSELGIP